MPLGLRNDLRVMVEHLVKHLGLPQACMRLALHLVAVARGQGSSIVAMDAFQAMWRFGEVVEYVSANSSARIVNRVRSL